MINAINSVVQTVPAAGSVVFDGNGYVTGYSVRHTAGSSRFVINQPGVYLVQFIGNIALPEGGTVAPISVGLSVDGEVIAGTEAVYTPAAVEEYGNVTAATLVQVYGCGGCGGNVSVAVVNTSGVPIDVDNANLLIVRQF